MNVKLIISQWYTNIFVRIIRKSMVDFLGRFIIFVLSFYFKIENSVLFFKIIQLSLSHFPPQFMTKFNSLLTCLSQQIIKLC